MILLSGFALYLHQLDQEIQQRFSGNKWSLPARVYARPLELFIARAMQPDQLLQHLQSIGYTRSNYLTEPGRYKHNGNTIQIYTRAFSYWDGELASQLIHVRFDAQSIASIHDAERNKDLAYIRLEPQLVGKIYPLHNQDRVLVPYNEVPQSLVDGLIAIEDRSFFYHYGIDPKGILRAFIANFRSGGYVQGGSTLTQQLVKNFFLTSERTLTRKINEMFMALLLEYRFNKAEIMSAYINEVYLGQDGARGIHGFGTAAEFYYGKPLQELSIAQLAMLVGLVKGASYYNPVRNTERALKRRNLVLDMMHDLGFLESSLLDKAKREITGLKTSTQLKRSMTRAFMERVRQQLLETYKFEQLQNEGLRIFTTLDPLLQISLYKELEQRLTKLENSSKKISDLQAAVIISTVDTGEILALAGSRSPKHNSFNRALDTRRSIGSLVKPFVYLSALENLRHLHPLSEIEDKEITIAAEKGRSWQPRNYSGKSHGKVSLLEALARSYNLATVSLGMETGLEKIIETLNRAGVEQKIRPYPSLLLGALNLTPLEVTQMYQVLASGGFRSELTVLQQVLTHDGRPLQKSDVRVQQVIESKYTAMINSMLQVVTESGTARSLKSSLGSTVTLAAKTGTTNDLRDSWFAGFDANHIGVVWIGKDDNSSTGLTGASGALRVWGDIMKHLPLTSLEPVSLPELQWKKVKSLSGSCSDGYEIAFLQHHRIANELVCE